jgi:hypothetical protein
LVQRFGNVTDDQWGCRCGRCCRSAAAPKETTCPSCRRVEAGLWPQGTCTRAVHPVCIARAGMRATGWRLAS